MLFELGQIVATPGALGAMREASVTPAQLLRRHIRGDWGDLCAEDRAANDAALINDTRIFSSYKISSTVKIWLITEADRHATTFLLPEEY